MILLIFDIDGTLVKPTTLEDTAFLSAFCTAFGFENVDGDWSAYQNVTDSGILAEAFQRQAGRPPMPSEVRRFRSAYETALRSALTERPGEGGEIAGASVFIAGLAESGCRMAYATGNWRSVARLKLARAALPHRDVPLASADDGMAREALLRIAVERAMDRNGGEAFRSILAIGDAPWDARAAGALGMTFIGVGERWLRPGDWPCAGSITDYTNGAAVRQMIAELADSAARS